MLTSAVVRDVILRILHRVENSETRETFRLREEVFYEVCKGFGVFFETPSLLDAIEEIRDLMTVFDRLPEKSYARASLLSEIRQFAEEDRRGSVRAELRNRGIVVDEMSDAEVLILWLHFYAGSNWASPKTLPAEKTSPPTIAGGSQTMISA